jgi:hypothetical protein
MTRINGKLHRFSLGFYPRSSLADARAQAEQVLRDAAKGISPKDREAEEQRQAQAERLNSFRAVAAEFMEDHAKNLRTRYEVQRMINADLLPAWGDRPISSITRADIKALLREKASTAPIAANRVLSLISKIFSWAPLDEEIIGASPADAQRTIRIVGEDGKVDFVAINQRVAALDYVMNDVTVAAYDVVLDQGPSYATKREEAREGMLTFLQQAPSASPVVLDLIAEAQDWPNADKSSERLKTLLPPNIQALEARESGEPPPPRPSPDPAVMIEQQKLQVEQQKMQVDQFKIQS